MLISKFISIQLNDRQDLLTKIHEIILEEDKTIKTEVKAMIGKEMIVYNASAIFKYGLSSVKNYMSLHVMPMYGSITLYSKYKAILPNAKFQKGCINFKNEEEVPLEIVRQLIHDCSGIDLLAIKESYLNQQEKKIKSFALITALFIL